MTDKLTLTPCDNEPELSDPLVTGEFAAEMASLATIEHVPPFCAYVAREGGVPVGFGGFKGRPTPRARSRSAISPFPPIPAGGWPAQWRPGWWRLPGTMARRR